MQVKTYIKYIFMILYILNAKPNFSIQQNGNFFSPIEKFFYMHAPLCFPNYSFHISLFYGLVHIQILVKQTKFSFTIN